MRRLLAVLSACGLAISIVAYVKSLSGATTDDLNPWVAVLVVGALALQIPIPFLEHSWSEGRRLFWKRLRQRMPRWALVCINLFWLIALAHLVWVFVRSDAAIPIIKDGQYVLSNHGRIRRVLTEQEYLTLKAADLKLFAAFMMACYITPMLYWWLPRKRSGETLPPALSC
jgi:hypothetical protein